ncbi:uncharacterized protein LOC131408961 [Diceros bicornis minor]|uniref:uncharacterized protein LOC131408961 n=1 Tax=Diceros bicornis minor TaxID=77932 RepID=UPI0026EE2CA2|nr:uncharacterized protein LOC131408961 [Diceros bicornis minor]
MEMVKKNKKPKKPQSNQNHKTWGNSFHLFSFLVRDPSPSTAGAGLAPAAFSSGQWKQGESWAPLGAPLPPLCVYVCTLTSPRRRGRGQELLRASSVRRRSSGGSQGWRRAGTRALRPGALRRSPGVDASSPLPRRLHPPPGEQDVDALQEKLVLFVMEQHAWPRTQRSQRGRSSGSCGSCSLAATSRQQVSPSSQQPTMQEKKQEEGVRELSWIPETPEPPPRASQAPCSPQRAEVLRLSARMSGSAGSAGAHGAESRAPSSGRREALPKAGGLTASSMGRGSSGGCWSMT